MRSIANLRRLAFCSASLLLIPASSLAAFNWYSTSASWDAARAASNYTSFWGAENFEQSTAPGGGGWAVDDPLQTGVANGAYFPGGLLHPDLTVQANLDPTGMTVGMHGASGLAVFTAGWGSVVSDIVIANYFVDSIDVIFGPGMVNAAGFAPIVYSGGGDLTIKAFDVGNNLLGQTTTPSDPSGLYFIGAVSDTLIARINIYSAGGNAEGLDNLSTYVAVPEPATLVALGLGALALIRRRRTR